MATKRTTGDKAWFRASHTREQITTLFDRPDATIHVRTVPERMSTATKFYAAIKDRKRVRLKFSGTFDELQATLQHRNKCGFAPFFTINPTDGLGVKRDNIVEVRNICLDLDGAPLPKKWSTPPNLIVKLRPASINAFGTSSRERTL